MITYPGLHDSKRSDLAVRHDPALPASGAPRGRLESSLKIAEATAVPRSTKLSVPAHVWKVSGSVEFTIETGPFGGRSFTEAFEAYVSNKTYRIVHSPVPELDPVVARIEIDWDGSLCRRGKFLRESANVAHEADVFVTSGPHPPDGDPVATLIWLTYCSAGVFSEGTNPSVKPLTFLGMAYERADIRLNAIVHLMSDRSGRIQSRYDIHPPFQFLWTNNELEKRAISGAFTNLAFSALQWTNAASGKIPADAELILSSYHPDTRLPQVDFSARLRLAGVEAAGAADVTSELPSRIHVRDARYSELGTTEPVYYKSTTGKVLPVANVKNTEEYRSSLDRSSPRPGGTSVAIPLAIIGFLGIALALFFASAKRRPSE
jgi:hypothetical protein